MGDEKKKDLNYQFVSLVFSLQQAAMAQLGKIANPATGKIEKNLAQAKATIDMLEMLKEKSKGNLTDTEQKMILNMLDSLYLNYADEVGGKGEKKPTPAQASPVKEEKSREAKAREEKKEKPARNAGGEEEKFKERKE